MNYISKHLLPWQPYEKLEASYIDVLSQELMSCLGKEVILVYFEQ
jgi:hypothetical protein